MKTFKLSIVATILLLFITSFVAPPKTEKTVNTGNQNRHEDQRIDQHSLLPGPHMPEVES